MIFNVRTTFEFAVDLTINANSKEEAEKIAMDSFSMTAGGGFHASDDRIWNYQGDIHPVQKNIPVKVTDIAGRNGEGVLQNSRHIAWDRIHLLNKRKDAVNHASDFSMVGLALLKLFDEHPDFKELKLELDQESFSNDDGTYGLRTYLRKTSVTLDFGSMCETEEACAEIEELFESFSDDGVLGNLYEVTAGYLRIHRETLGPFFGLQKVEGVDVFLAIAAHAESGMTSDMKEIADVYV